MSDEQAREVYREARLGQSLTWGERPGVLVIDFTCGFTDPECILGSDLSAEVEATQAAPRRGAGEGPSGRLHDHRARAASAATVVSGCRRPLRCRAPARRALGRGRPAARPARRRARRAEEGRVGLLRHEPRHDPPDPGRRHRDPLRGDHVGLRPRHGDRPAAARLADAGPARVRRRPRAGSARGEPVRHPGEVRRRRLAPGSARVRRERPGSRRDRRRRRGRPGPSLLVPLPGDCIGPEVAAEARRVLEALLPDVEIEERLFGGEAIRATGAPLPDETLAACRARTPS